MTLGAIADAVAGKLAGQIDTDRDAVGEIGIVGIDQPLAIMQRTQSGGVEQRVAATKADLRQPRALPHQHRKSARRDFGIERAFVARRDLIEAVRAIGDNAGEHVEPAGRAFRIGGGGNIGRQRQAFHQRHDMHAAGFQHSALTQIDPVQFEIFDALCDRRLRTGQEARAHAIGGGAQAKIETCGLHLPVGKRRCDTDMPGRRQFRDHAVRQNAAASAGSVGATPAPPASSYDLDALEDGGAPQRHDPSLSLNYPGKLCSGLQRTETPAVSVVRVAASAIAPARSLATQP